MTPESLAKLHYACDKLTHVAADIRNETNDVVATNDHVEIIKHYDYLRKVNALIKESREALNGIEERLSREHIPDAMRNAHIKSTTIEGVGRVSLSRRWSASMIDKSTGMQWLRDSGNGGVIFETVNSQTLGALAKELNEKGVDLPADIFNTNVMTFTSITKA